MICVWGANVQVCGSFGRCAAVLRTDAAVYVVATTGDSADVCAKDGDTTNHDPATS